MKAFIDTSFFVALADKDDKHHKEAKECFLSQIDDKVSFSTSNLVLAETLTFLRFRVGFKYAREFGEKFRHSELIKTIWVHSHLEKEAWNLFSKYSDKDLSYVDVLSFACIKLNRIDYALTFDKHFMQVGLKAVPILV